MAFVAEDGTGLELANSYADVSFADSYFTDRNIVEWENVTNKESLLIRATDFIDTKYKAKFVSTKLLQTQGLAFPRVNYGVPIDVKKATVLLALSSKSSELLPDLERVAIEETVGEITVKYSEKFDINTNFQKAELLLQQYLLNNSGSTFSLSNISRTY